MDFDLKQWRNQEESEAKVPRLVLDLHSTTTTASHGGGGGGSSSSALPLFVSEPPTSKLSAFSSDSTPTATTKFPRMGGSYFSLGQWQELELQALIFRHMIAGAPVPPELLHLVKKSLFNSAPYYFPHPLHQYPHYHPASAPWYWGRAAMDPEPGRCRRTDGKKWRCSRDVVAGQKYCERHMHRGRNRSRKPVEIPTPTPPTAAGGPTADAQPLSAVPGRDAPPHFTLSAATAPPSSSIDLFHLSQRHHGEPIMESNGPLEAQKDGPAGGQTLRHFFDDWPRPLEENESSSAVASATNLSISIPGNASSDFSLKLATGPPLGGNMERTTAAWGTSHHQVQVGSAVGGPLAEALRSSTSNSSPTSVLHQLQRNSTTSETSFITS
ncbi:PREDICTED: growth-regulating factor 3-like isoform X2 [Ipomoea nil]|uniref:growth-regulating factor 3-like isoform X2 n=1 Tax=Ipomoea nil TaxID=35883 RepID=UPI000900F511|nr:PREDICTED: growth-regulating factor 3-like isoform X2 [Ipomoea nil]